MRLSLSWALLPAGRVRWHVAPAYRDRLPDGLPDEPESVGTVKNGPHRTVERVQVAGVPAFWKHCRMLGLRGWLRQGLRPPKAKIEFDKALALAARGVPTVEPIAWGTRSTLWPSDSYLITRALEGTEPLDRFLEVTLPGLPQGRRAGVRREVAEELGAFLARLHDAGVTHPDLHPGNLLVELPDGGRPRFFLIDLHAIALTGPLDWRASRDNLVLVNRWFILRASRADRLRFWQNYHGARGALSHGGPLAASRALVPLTPVPSPPALRGRGGEEALAAAAPLLRYRARELERATVRSNLAFWRGREPRCLGTNRYFRRARTPGVDAVAVRDLDAEFLAGLLADPDAPFRRPAAPLLKNSRSSTVAELAIPTPDGPRPAIYKRFLVTARTDPLRNLVRPSSASRSWRMGHALIDRRLPTPRPLAVLHRRRGGMSWEAYLLTEKVEDACELHEHLNRLDRLLPGERREAFLDCLGRIARLVRDLHNRHVSHRDLKAANLLIGPGGAVTLIDLVGVRTPRRLGEPRRVKDLARLHASFRADPRVSRTDKLRFLATYLDWGLVGRDGWKAWWREVARATQAKIDRNRKRNRPLV